MASKYKVVAADGSVVGEGRMVTRRGRRPVAADGGASLAETIVVDADGCELAFSDRGVWANPDTYAAVAVVPVRSVAVVDLATADLDALLGA